MTPLTVLDKVVEALQAAGATEEMIAAAVGAAGEFGDSPPRPNGRPRKYADRALRDRAYRERKKARDEMRDEIRAIGSCCRVVLRWPRCWRGWSDYDLAGCRGAQSHALSIFCLRPCFAITSLNASMPRSCTLINLNEI